MALKELDTLLELTNLLWTHPLQQSDLNVPLAKDSLEFHLWNTWLQWIPGPEEEPLSLGAGWTVQRHATHQVAVLNHHDDPQSPDMGGTVYVPPIEDLSFDPVPHKFFVVGMAPNWKRFLDDPELCAESTTWAQAILCVLEQFEYGWLGHYWTFPATGWIIDEQPCVLVNDGNV